MDEYIKREDVLAVLTCTDPPYEIVPQVLATARKKVRRIPAADVVPKSEVEKIFEEFEKIIHGYRIDKLLAELGVHIVKNGELTLEQQLAELKKKYTAQNTNNFDSRQTNR